MSRLSPIYVCDALSFFPYDKLQQSRLVNRYFNNIIVGRPTRFQAHRRFSDFYVNIWLAEGNGVKVDAEGYVETESSLENWKRLHEEWGCCSELKDDASPLAGECILPFRPHGGLVDIVIWNADGSKRVSLRVRNKMTIGTAFGPLHLFDHLRNAAVGRMRLCDVLNPILFQLLSVVEHYRLHVRIYYFNASPTTVKVHVANFAHLSTKLLRCSVVNLAAGFDFALRARRHCKKLAITHGGENLFDIALQHFQTILPAIGRHVVSVLGLCIMVRSHPIPWPAALLPKEEMESLGQGLYRQRGLTNINSGERFDVEVTYKAPWWRTVEEVDTVRLLFREEK